jgi:two-component system, OmpR family, response regulator
VSARVLVCDDEPQILRALRVVLREAGFDAVPAATAQRALDLAALDPPDAAILDLVLPDGDGIDVCRSLREWSRMPILLLSAVGDEDEKIRALEAGADDYIVKPFQFDELWARVRSVIRRSQGRVIPVFSHGDIEVDRSRRVVSKAGAEVTLSAHEYRTLLALLERPGHVVTRDHLQDAVYGSASAVESNTIAVFIHQLRRKLGDDLIRTVHGHGYVVGQPRP